MDDRAWATADVKRIVALTTATLLSLLTIAPSLAMALGSTWGTGGRPITTDSGVGWHYSAEQQAFFQTPQSYQPASDEPEVDWSYVPTCDSNVPGGDANLCRAAMCTTGQGDPGVFFWVLSRPRLPLDSPWDVSGTQCIAGERRVDLAEVEAEVRRIIEDKFREIARPSVSVAPADRALVNLPVLAWTDDPGDVTLAIEQPLPGEIRASPSYLWSWSNGVSSHGPGRPYSSSISPTAVPDSYLHSVFRARGDETVTLTVTWTGDVTVPGLAPIEIAPLVYETTAPFAVREARAELVDPYG